MENCARCGKELLWNEQKMVFWNKQLKKGYIKWYVIGSMEFGKRKEFPEYKGKKLCQLCAHEVFKGARIETREIVSNQTDCTQTAIAVEAITDFQSLRVYLKQNGVVMSAFNCPKCGGMVDIPENGKLLICKHCGNPIKPAEIAEKIKALTE
jgi:DNA-directed RNA polymerase subunit RPC12/RpoP